MTTDEPSLAETHTPAPACRHLRCKGMYVYTDGMGGGESHDDYDNTVYWCFRTMKDFGPDDQQADREACCQASRTCFESF